MTWLWAGRRYLSLAGVQEIILPKDQERGRVTLVYADGERREVDVTVTEIHEALGRDQQVVLPGDGMGLKCHHPWRDAVTKEVFVSTYPIVGWRLHVGTIEPLAPGLNIDSEPGEMRLVELADGRCVEGDFDGTEYSNLEAALEEFKRRISTPDAA